MTDAFIELRAAVRTEARVSCGCRLVLAQQEAIDAREGKFLTSPCIVIVPCKDLEHVPLATELGAAFVGETATNETMHRMVALMEARLDDAR